MSNSSLDQIRGSKAPSVTELVAETRIDAAHPHAPGTAPQQTAGRAAGEESDIPLGAWDCRDDTPASPDPEAISQQSRIQAAQLAEHLRGRQQQLDHREAELNAWAAQLERDARAARLWLEERTAEMEDRAETPESILVEEESIRRMAEALSHRQQRLAEAESEVESHEAAVKRLHEQLLADRQLLEEQSHVQRERLAVEEARLTAEVEEKRREVQKRCEHADQAQVALEQLRVELGRMHRETLEIRLATEELWAELSGSASPTALTRSLGRIRSRLADHYRIANQELHQKKEELEQLRAQLSEQYEKLVRQKHNFDAWAAECREEVEQQTSRLQARGVDLDRREADMSQYARRTQAEKLELQHEIRRLRAKLIGKAEAELPV